MIGNLLNDRYRLDAELGQGGMGVVYRAHDTLLNRTVAVKLVSKATLGTEGRARLMNEAKAAAQLNHPNIVSIHDAGESDGLPFVVMELVEGDTLHDRRPAEFDQIISVAQQVCNALSHAHAHGIVHRDLKPENVQIAPDGTAKLTDFGLARSVASRISSEGTIVGTVFYLAPELALGQPFDGRADLYALGVMLYELATGGLPFVADDPLAVISQHIHAPVVPPRAKNPNVPASLDALITHLLSKDPSDRPHSAIEVQDTLERLASGEQMPATEVQVGQELSMLDRIVRGRLVGRDDELAEIRALWHKASSGEARMLLISGEPGVGKTRLMHELVTQVEVSGSVALVGTCYAEGSAPYAPFAQIVRTALLNGLGDALDLTDFVLSDLITLAPDLRLHYTHVPPNPPLDPESEQQRMFESVVTVCTALNERAPLLMALEDAHWADSGTLSLLRHLARRTRHHRMLIVATYREVELDETLPFRDVLLDLSRERLALRMKLSRLDREETRDLLATLFAEEITPEFLEGIYRETEGNPFFVEEVCKALIESGELYYADGRWHRPSMDELEIPQSVRVAIQSRVRKLPTQVQDTLRIAAILGREFDFDTLAQASDLTEDALIDALEIAEGAQLIEEVTGESSVSFAFPHALVPATLAKSVRTLRRRRLHRRAANAIETVRPGDYEALAYHCAQAGEDERALTYFTRAGERAAAAYSNREAEEYFRSALELAPPEATEAHLLSELGIVLARQSRHEEAIQTWRRGIELYQSLGEQDGIARLYARSARAVWDGGDTPRGLELCREGRAAVAGAQESPDMANLLHETARACWFNGLLDEAVPLCRQALEMAERLGVVEVQAEALTTLGTLPGQHIETRLAALAQAVELAEHNRLLAQASRVHNNLAVVLVFDDVQAAREHFLRAAEAERQRGFVAGELFCATNAVGMSLLLGDFTSAEEQLQTLRELVDATPDPGLAEIPYRATEARLLRYRGGLLEATKSLRRLRADARVGGDLQMLSGLDNALGDALWELGEFEEAELVLAEAVPLGDQGVGFGSVVPRCTLSVLHSGLGDLGQARLLLAEARDRVEGLGSRAGETASLLRAEAHLAAAERRCSDALVAFETAAGELAQAGMRWLRARLLSEWAAAHLSRGEPEDRGQARELLFEAQVEFEAMAISFYAARIGERLMEMEDGK